jgi:carboxypeptidase C (cathepsin A)
MEDLAQAMIANPHLHVEVENGIYDLATPFFATEYTMEHLGLPAKLQSHIVEKYYDAGHMMYVNEAELAKLKENVGKFIDETSRH